MRGAQGIAVIKVLITLFTALLALALPAAWFGMNYSAAAGAISTKAEVKAEALSQLAASTPDLWRYNEHRIRDLLMRQPLDLNGDTARVIAADGDLLVEVDGKPRWPVIHRSAGLYDNGVEVGRVEVIHSIHPLLIGTLSVGVGALLLALGVNFGLRVLVLRAGAAVKALDEERARAQAILHSISDAVIATDAGDRVDYLNPVAEALTGWTLAEARGRDLSEVVRLIDENSLEPIENPLRRVMHEHQPRLFEGSAALVRRDGSSVAIEERAAPIVNEDGKVVGAVTIFGDVSAARSMALRITWAATHDTLTGLVNRREFEARVETALTSARNSDLGHVLCYLDLDQFKVVNDTCGHAAGDALLKQLATLLQAHLRDSDTLARLGGDEFGVLLQACPLERAERIAAELMAAVGALRFSWDGKVFAVGVSVGLAAVTAQSESTAALLSAADSACYLAKEQGRNRVCVYRSADVDMARRRQDMDWTSRLTLALEQQRFVLYYQRYRALGSAGEQHLEILLRLIDEQGAVVLPGSFLPAAERYNLMPAIDRWVIAEVCRRYAGLTQSLGTPLVCAINLSGTSLNTEGLADYILEQTRLHDIAPASLCFEITETAAINNLSRTAELMKGLSDNGFRFALDDFGTGTSSFGYLRSLPVNYLKIDGHFVRQMDKDPMDRAMTESINRIGHIMGLKTVAEFAETDLIIDELRAVGVDFAQGYGVERPRPVPDGPAGLGPSAAPPAGSEPSPRA